MIAQKISRPVQAVSVVKHDLFVTAGTEGRSPPGGILARAALSPNKYNPRGLGSAGGSLLGVESRSCSQLLIMINLCISEASSSLGSFLGVLIVVALAGLGCIV